MTKLRSAAGSEDSLAALKLVQSLHRQGLSSSLHPHPQSSAQCGEILEVHLQLSGHSGGHPNSPLPRGGDRALTQVTQKDHDGRWGWDPGQGRSAPAPGAALWEAPGAQREINPDPDLKVALLRWGIRQSGPRPSFQRQSSGLSQTPRPAKPSQPCHSTPHLAPRKPFQLRSCQAVRGQKSSSPVNVPPPVGCGLIQTPDSLLCSDTLNTGPVRQAAGLPRNLAAGPESTISLHPAAASAARAQSPAVGGRSPPPRVRRNPESPEEALPTGLGAQGAGTTGFSFPPCGGWDMGFFLFLPLPVSLLSA